MRFEGPVLLRNQLVLAADWMTYVDDDLSQIIPESVDIPGAGFPTQVIATGPTVRSSAMPEGFASLMYAATERLTITTP